MGPELDLAKKISSPIILIMCGETSFNDALISFPGMGLLCGCIHTIGQGSSGLFGTLCFACGPLNDLTLRS